MRSKREEARRAAAARKAQVAQAARAAQRAHAAAAAAEKDVTPWLRQLGFRADEARLAAAHCADMPEASLEDRVRKALAFFHPRAKRYNREGRLLTPSVPVPAPRAASWSVTPQWMGSPEPGHP